METILHDLTNSYIENPSSFSFIFMGILDGFFKQSSHDNIYLIIEHVLIQHLLDPKDLVHLATVYADNSLIIDFIQEAIWRAYPSPAYFRDFFNLAPESERMQLIMNLNHLLGGEETDFLF